MAWENEWVGVQNQPKRCENWGTGKSTKWANSQKSRREAKKPVGESEKTRNHWERFARKERAHSQFSGENSKLQVT